MRGDASIPESECRRERASEAASEDEMQAPRAKKESRQDEGIHENGFAFHEQTDVSAYLEGCALVSYLQANLYGKDPRGSTHILALREGKQRGTRVRPGTLRHKHGHKARRNEGVSPFEL